MNQEDIKGYIALLNESLDPDEVGPNSWELARAEESIVEQFGRAIGKIAGKHQLEEIEADCSGSGDCLRDNMNDVWSELMKKILEQAYEDYEMLGDNSFNEILSENLKLYLDGIGFGQLKKYF
jgi:hypothetical protein